MCHCTGYVRFFPAMLLCLIAAPFANAQAKGRAIYLTPRSSLCIEALSSFRACVPASLFSGTILEAPKSLGIRKRHLKNQARWSNGSCSPRRSITQKQRRRRLMESLTGVSLPELSFSVRGLKLAMDIETDLTGIHYNGIKLQYQTCW